MGLWPSLEDASATLGLNASQKTTSVMVIWLHHDRFAQAAAWNPGSSAQDSKRLGADMNEIVKTSQMSK